MKQDDLLLKEAYRSFEKKLYAESAVLLDRMVSSGIRDTYPVLLHAACCLLAGRFADADGSMRRLEHIDPAYPPLLQLRTFLYFKGAPDLKSAVTFSLEALAKNPGDVALRRMVSRLRNVRDFARFQRESRLLDFVSVPSPSMARFSAALAKRNPFRAGKGRRLLPRTYRIAAYAAAGVIAAAVAVAFLAVYVMPSLRPGSLSREAGDTVDQVTIDGSGFNLIEKITTTRNREFYQSGEMVLRDFNTAKKMIREGRYNGAIRILNRIATSNAVYPVRERADFLRKFVINIEDRDWEDIAFREVRESPHLYIGTAVKWKGRIANLRKREGGVVFNLMVNSRNAGEFDGVVDVYSGRDYAGLQGGDTIIVKAVILHSIGEEKRLYLSAREIETPR